MTLDSKKKKKWNGEIQQLKGCHIEKNDETKIERRKDCRLKEESVCSYEVVM